MIRCLVLLLVLTLAGLARAQQRIELDDGRVLENARIIRQDAATVTIVHSGGITQVEKILLPPELRAGHPIDPKAVEAEARARREAPAARPAAEPPPSAASSREPAPTDPVPPSAPAPAPAPALVVHGACVWRDPLGRAIPLVTAHGFIVERTAFLPWARVRRERHAATGRRLLIDFINTVGDDLRHAARMRLEHFVALSVAEPPPEAVRVAADAGGRFAVSVPGGRSYVLVVTASVQDGAEVRALTWFDRLDGGGDRRLEHDATTVSVGDWSFAE